LQFKTAFVSALLVKYWSEWVLYTHTHTRTTLNVFKWSCK